MIKLDKEYRKKMYDYAVKIGFIIPTDHVSRIKTYIERGYRVVGGNKEIKVINLIKPMSVNPYAERDIKYLYKWLTSTQASPKKARSHN